MERHIGERSGSPEASDPTGVSTPSAPVGPASSIEADPQRRFEQQGQILRAVAHAAERFLSASTWRDPIADVLRSLGESAEVSRVYVFENEPQPDGGARPEPGRRHEWVRPGDSARFDDPERRPFSFRTPGTGRWRSLLAGGGIVRGHARELPDAERSLLQEQGVRSVLLVPIHPGGRWWGLIGFDQCDRERDWSDPEVEVLKAAAGILGASIERERSEQARHQSEERYRSLVELSPDAIAIHSDGRLVFVNEATVRLLGARSREDLIGRPILDIVHPDFHQVVEERTRREIEQGEHAPLLEERFVRLDGVTIDVEVAGMPFVHEGKPAGQVVVRDVTERKRAEAALRRQNEYLAALHQTTLGVINRLDVSDLLGAIVNRAATLAGTEHGYLYLGHPHGDRLQVEVGIGLFAEFIGYGLAKGVGLAGKVWSTGQALMVYDYDKWDGRDPAFPRGVLHAGLGVPLTSAGQVVGVIGLSHHERGKTFDVEEIDVLSRFAELASIALDNARLYDAATKELVERQRVEQQLIAAEAKYRTLVEQIPAITYIDELDPTEPAGYRTQYVSPQIESMLGYSPPEFMAQPGLWPDLIHPEDRERVLLHDAAFYRQGGDYRDEYRLISRDGRVVWVKDAAKLVRDPAGRPRFAQGVVYDITEGKRAEVELQRALEREREATHRLRALDDMKTTFLHAVSHELRTPLSAVLGLALTLQRRDMELSDDQTRELLDRLAANARKLDRLLSDLLDLDRLDRGIVAPRRRPTDLGELVRRTVDGLDFLIGREVHVDADDVEVSVDGPKVERIMENLLANAARHTPAGTPLWVRISARGGGALIAVEDSGEGVAEELRSSIFEPFRRGPDAPRHSPGVGIGLSLVARFAELHGGRAWVEDRPGGGASFRVFLAGAPEDLSDQPFATGAPTSEPYSVQDPS